ncbi:MAG TPA: flagellar basal body L-ring protein FlgH [Tepidisphaeraceae bacterium]|nr:flagellar basal body L-ring protein FlgH [Tepidisphaeraceae bacterium]
MAKPAKPVRIIALSSIALGTAGAAQHEQRVAPPASPPPITTQALMQGSGGSLLQASGPLQAEPMNSKTPSYNLYAVAEPEPKVLKKHDLINVIVREESQSSSKGTTDLKRNADLDAKVDSFIKLNPSSFTIQGGTLKNPPEIKMSGTRNFKGDATAERTDTVVVRLEGEVLDVKPNGTMVVQARKHIKTEDEEQTFILTGVCRVQDVDASNSVLSTDLHDLDLQKITTGAVRDTTKRGLVGRLLDFLNPF